jgi:hypothetical protein
METGTLYEEAPSVSLIAALLLSYLTSLPAVVFCVPRTSVFALRRVVRVSWIVLFSERCYRSTDGCTLRRAVVCRRWEGDLNDVSEVWLFGLEGVDNLRHSFLSSPSSDSVLVSGSGLPRFIVMSSIPSSPFRPQYVIASSTQSTPSPSLLPYA